jgi:hypothetical protein
MRKPVELARSREFGDIISDTFVLLRQNFKPLFKAILVICGLFLVSDMFVSIFIATSRQDPSVETLVGIVRFLWALIYVIMLLLTTQAYFVLYKEHGNQPPALVQVWGYVRYYFFRVFFTAIILAIALGLATVFCGFPFFYLFVVFSLVFPVMMNENGNIEFSIRKAFKIIKGNWWYTFGVILLTSIVTGVLMFILFAPVLIIYLSGQWLTGKDINTIASVLFAIDLNIAKLVWIIPSIAIVLTYYTFVEEKEGTSLVERIKMFGQNGTATDQISSEQY